METYCIFTYFAVAKEDRDEGVPAPNSLKICSLEPPTPSSGEWNGHPILKFVLKDRWLPAATGDRRIEDASPLRARCKIV